MTAPNSPGPVTMASMLPRLLRSGPPGRRAELEALIAEGRAAAAAGQVSDPADGEVPVSELLRAEQDRIRREALERCLPADRAVLTRPGLACLDDNQSPGKLAGWLRDPMELTLVLAGTTGSGKTTAAYAVAAEAAIHSGAAMRDRRDRIATRNLLVRAWTVPKYLAELRPDGSPHPAWRIRDMAYTAELLIVDDLGAETDSVSVEFVRRELVNMIDHRVDARLRTIVTTNLRGAHVQERFGPRLFSRLSDRATSVTFKGPDRRTLRKMEW
jgi:hypothetical protein